MIDNDKSGCDSSSENLKKHNFSFADKWILSPGRSWDFILGVGCVNACLKTARTFIISRLHIM